MSSTIQLIIKYKKNLHARLMIFIKIKFVYAVFVPVDLCCFFEVLLFGGIEGHLLFQRFFSFIFSLSSKGFVKLTPG